MKIDIYLGQICKGLIEGNRPNHLNIKISHHKFASLMRAPMTEREIFTAWINKEVYPALDDVPEKKITIELTR